MPEWEVLGGDGRVELVGELRIANARAIWAALRAATRVAPREIDVTRVTAIDGTVMSLLGEVTRGTDARLVGAPPRIAELAHLYLGGPPVPPRPYREPALERIGAGTRRAGRSLADILQFTGELVRALGAIVRHPRSANWHALPALVERAGTDGLPIVIVLNFLVGFVGAFQSIIPLRQFGADVYVADIVGISVTRELAPLITGVIISGRSGAAFAAELGTMRVSEEIDALRTMGIAPHPYLVVPRVIALALVAPVLTLLGVIAGVLGGLAVAVGSLHMTSEAYLTELRTMVVASDVWTGLLKSAAFGIAIALIACRQGLSTRGAAAGVGRGTTATVVSCLFAIVILDTLFTVTFRGFGL